MNRTLNIIAIILLLLTQRAVAEPPSSKDHAFVGNWVSECDAWGADAICTSKWSQGAHNSHLVQDYTIRHASNGAEIFSGRGVYRVEDAAVQGSWEGSNGAIHPISGQISKRDLYVVWGRSDTEIGRSEYELREGKLVVRDFVLTKLGWQEFMAVTYLRVD